MTDNERERAKWDNVYSTNSLPPKGSEEQSIYLEVADYAKKIFNSQKSKRVLEAGSGSGLHSLALAKAGFDVEMLDFSDNALDTAKKIFQRAGLVAKQHQGDILAEDGLKNFDLVFNSGVLEHYSFEEQVGFVRGMALRSRKYVLVLVPNRECYWYWVWRVKQQSLSNWPWGYEKPALDYAKVFSKAGVRLIDKPYFGSDWTEWYIASLGLPNEIQTIIQEIHRIGIADINTRSYLVGFLGIKEEIENTQNTTKHKWIRATSERKDKMDQMFAHAADVLSLAISTQTRLDTQVASLNQLITERDRNILDNQAIIEERDAQVQDLAREISMRDAHLADVLRASDSQAAQIQGLNRKLEERDAQVQDLPKVLRRINQLSLAFKSPRARYNLLKSVYWHLPRFFRMRLNGWRYRYVANHLFSLSQRADIDIESEKQPEWLNLAARSPKIAIIPSAFEFEELVNQRPINAAKHFAEQGYLVLFISWQWSPEDAPGRIGVVWNSIYQIPLFEFAKNSIFLSACNADSLYLLTLPANILVSLVPYLRQKGLSIVYDIMDDWEEFHRVGQAPWYRRDVEENIILQSDYVCAVTPTLSEKFDHLRSDIELIGNGYYEDIIGIDNRGIARRQNKEKKIVGYFGHLTDAWFDWDLIFYLAESNVDTFFEIIGYGEPEWVLNKAKSVKNITLFGKVQPQHLHKHVRDWSVGIIPFVEGRLAMAVDPIKIYEYIYFGLPTIVTGIEHVKKYPMTIYANRQDVPGKLNELLSNGIQLKDDSEEFLLESTWSARFSKLIYQLSEKRGISALYDI